MINMTSFDVIVAVFAGMLLRDAVRSIVLGLFSMSRFGDSSRYLNGPVGRRIRWIMAAW